MSLFSLPGMQTPMSPTNQLLRSAEALTMPAVQVIVLNANMNCEECRERVSKVLSKIDYLMDYVVDVTHKKVTVRGRVDPQKRIHRIELTNDKMAEAIEFESPGDGGYPTDLQQQYCSKIWRKATENLIERGCCFRFVV